MSKNIARNCPICGQLVKIGGFHNHLKLHKMKLKDFIKNFDNRRWYETWRNEAQEESKSRSPMCLEFYKRKYPDLPEAEQIKIWKEHLKYRKELSAEVSKRTAERLGNIPDYYKNKGKKDKETSLTNIMYKNNCSRKEAEEIFRQMRVDASLSSPMHSGYWVERGFNTEEAAVKALEYSRKYSVRCIEFWITRGLPLEEAEKKVSQIQRSCAIQNPHASEYWKDCNDPFKELKRYVYSIKHNNLLERVGYGDIKMDEDFLDSLFEDSSNIINFIADYRDKKNRADRAKNEYYSIVKFFTDLSLPFIPHLEFKKLNKPGPNELCVDHIYPTIRGFSDNVAPEIIGSPVNLRLMKRCDNANKGKKSDISLEELLKRYTLYLEGNFKFSDYPEYFIIKEGYDKI